MGINLIPIEILEYNTMRGFGQEDWEEFPRHKWDFDRDIKMKADILNICSYVERVKLKEPYKSANNNKGKFMNGEETILEFNVRITDDDSDTGKWMEFVPILEKNLRAYERGENYHEMLHFGFLPNDFFEPDYKSYITRYIGIREDLRQLLSEIEL